MTNHQAIEDDQPAVPATQKRQYPWPVFVVLALFIFTFFLSWYGTWFGRPLSDAKLEEYLNDRDKPRNVQHAVAQIGDRIIQGDQGVKRWYPALIEASRHSAPEIRNIAAWAMGQDNTNPEFQAALRQMLGDPDPSVRHNAALGLVRFNDPSGRQELVAMLKPRTVAAERAGVVDMVIEQEGVALAAGAPLARIASDSGEVIEVVAEEDSRVESIAVTDDSRVNAGDPLIVLLPSIKQVRETLKALYLVGLPEDVHAIENYTRPLPGLPEDVIKQARSTIEAIRARASK